MTKQQKAQGFTVIEVMIFLGISGLLIAIAFMGTGSSIARTRFTDGMGSVQAFLQQQYSDVQNGLNIRPDNPPVGCNPPGPDDAPGNSDCLMIGRLITFDPSGGDIIKVHPVISTNLDSSADASSTESDIILKYEPRVVVASSFVQTFDLPWQIKMVDSCNDSKLDTITAEQMLGTCNGSNQFDSYLIMRSPRSGAIQTYIFGGGWKPGPGNLPEGNRLRYTGTPSQKGYIDLASLSTHRRTGNICFSSPDLLTLYGGIQVGGRASGGQLGNTMTSDMDETTKEAVCGA